MARRPIITVCGSGKFREVIHRLCAGLTASGFPVLVPPLHNIDGLTANSPDEARVLAWKGATFAHLNRIAKCDVCVIANPTGYVGASSTLELGYAIGLRKLTISFRHDAELARDVLYDFVLDTDDVDEAVVRITRLVDDSDALGGSRG